MERKEQFRLPDIPESLKLADALGGIIRVRVRDLKDTRLSPSRHALVKSLRGIGIPFGRTRPDKSDPLGQRGFDAASVGSMSLEVTHGTLTTFRITDEIMEYVWGPDDAPRPFKPSTFRMPEWQQTLADYMGRIA